MEWMIYAFLLMYVTWFFYIGVMNLIRVKKTMPWQAKILAYPVAFVGVILDILLNVTIGTVLFLEWPKLNHLFFTARLQEHLDSITDTVPDGKLQRWRQACALWICEKLLDPFDYRGFHCRERNNSK